MPSHSAVVTTRMTTRYALITALWALAVAAHSPAHSPSPYGTNPRGIEAIDWHAEHISHTLSAGYPDSFGLFAFFNRQPTTLVEVAGQRCVRANFIALDVDDAFAFDIDATVSLSLTLAVNANQTLLVAYDGNAGSGAALEHRMTAMDASPLQQISLQLERARFAGRGMAGTDIALTALATMDPAITDEPAMITLCGLSMGREGSSDKALKAPSGTLAITITDAENGQPLAARLGLYDDSGRAVRASDDALLIHHYEHEVRDTALRDWEPWPESSRWVFYADGHYQHALPPGRYTLVVSHGPEYRLRRESFEITSGTTLALPLKLERWADEPARGWYSGDVHIHLPRLPADNARVSAFMAAEDLHAANILQAGNPAGHHFTQYAFGAEGSHSRGHHALMPGIESPRTAVRGHTIALNIDQIYPGNDDYFLYHRALQHYREQGAPTGYAHVGSEEFYASRGLALDVPVGLLDFVEVMQAGQLRTGLWYRYLNLGYQLTPAAGSDFPYFEHPGGVRSYVKVTGRWSPQAWLDGLKAGRTFVSNGPLLSFQVNGADMGSVIDIDKHQTLTISATARMNPDLGALESITLLRCGKPITTAKVARDDTGGLTLEAEVPAQKSGWLALRAEGSGKLSHTAPVYLRSERQPDWCADAADAALAEVLASLDALEAHTVEVYRELEYWQLGDLADSYRQQRPALLQRIKQARDAYRQLRLQNTN